MFHKLPKHTGIYNIRDNIEFLEFDVHFRHINSLLTLPKFEPSRNNTNKSAAKEGERHQQSEKDNVICVTRIRWQQKLLSPSEAELYKDARNCVTETHKEYHQWLIEDDVPTETSSGGAASNDVSKRGKRKKRQKRQKKSGKVEERAQSRWGQIFTYVHEDHFTPHGSDHVTTGSGAEQHSNTLASAPEPLQLMYVYAALTPDTQLLSLAWHPQMRQLRIYPDFNDFEVNPYYIEIDTDYRHLYAYAVHNVSQRRRLTNPAPFLQLPELATHWQEERDLSDLFAMPPKRTTRVALLFELRTASGFSYDNIHARYHIQLPPHTLLEEGLLHASTHGCSPSYTNGECYFGYNWQLTVLCEEEFNTAHLLHIYFELISIDSWERERVEGYAHYSTFLLAGWNSVKLQCLRPAESLLDSFSRYLIGGRRKFDYMRFYTDTNEDDEPMQCRYGCRMESTGELELTCQRFTQRNCELLQPCPNRTSGMTLDDIMLAYREARRRLEAVVLK
ncbi:Meckel syndrome type 1 protein homolog [Rhagoletis pomonella]|uniref:Meckel syndrome type 1 protein homolog n=1 Tax=Rhagoletis pomonella TaxID=28610 RepID=UPI001782AF46|nr:Meckel syndrome type 1 protein homolog [Rhagoletis pomonella]